MMEALQLVLAFDSFLAALRQMGRAKKLEELENRLSNIRHQMTIALLSFLLSVWATTCSHHADAKC